MKQSTPRIRRRVLAILLRQALRLSRHPACCKLHTVQGHAALHVVSKFYDVTSLGENCRQSQSGPGIIMRRRKQWPKSLVGFRSLLLERAALGKFSVDHAGLMFVCVQLLGLNCKLVWRSIDSTVVCENNMHVSKHVQRISTGFACLQLVVCSNGPRSPLAPSQCAHIGLGLVANVRQQLWQVQLVVVVVQQERSQNMDNLQSEIHLSTGQNVGMGQIHSVSMFLGIDFGWTNCSFSSCKTSLVFRTTKPKLSGFCTTRRKSCGSFGRRKRKQFSVYFLVFMDPFVPQILHCFQKQKERANLKAGSWVC